jgi:hypothetical protein
MIDCDICAREIAAGKTSCMVGAAYAVIVQPDFRESPEIEFWCTMHDHPHDRAKRALFPQMQGLPTVCDSLQAAIQRVRATCDECMLTYFDNGEVLNVIELIREVLQATESSGHTTEKNGLEDNN